MAYDCKLLKQPLKFIDEEVNASERQQIVDIIKEICQDPLVDGIKKFYFFRALPTIPTIYMDADWWIIYHKATESLLHIIHIGRRTERPHIGNSS